MVTLGIAETNNVSDLQHNYQGLNCLNKKLGVEIDSQCTRNALWSSASTGGSLASRSQRTAAGWYSDSATEGVVLVPKTTLVCLWTKELPISTCR